MNYNKYLKNLSWWEILIVLVVFFVLLYGLFCLNAWFFMIIWNSVMPIVFNLTTITFTQSAYLILLVWILRSFPVKINNTNA